MTENTLTPAELARAAKARAEAATEGPWEPLGTGVEGGDHWYVCDRGEAIASISAQDGINEAQREPDATFIAAARTDVPRLADAVLALTAERDALAAIVSEAPHTSGCRYPIIPCHCWKSKLTADALSARDADKWDEGALVGHGDGRWAPNPYRIEREAQ